MARVPGSIRYFERVVDAGNPNKNEASAFPLRATAPVGSLVKFESKLNCPDGVGLWKGVICRRMMFAPVFMECDRCT
jgi:hypothetical protein